MGLDNALANLVYQQKIVIHSTFPQSEHFTFADHKHSNFGLSQFL